MYVRGNVNISMLAAFDSNDNDYVVEIPNVCFEFRRAVNKIIFRSNELLIGYINSVQGDIERLVEKLKEEGIIE